MKKLLTFVAGGILISSFAYADGFVISNYNSELQSNGYHSTGITLNFSIDGMSKPTMKPGEYSYATTGTLSMGQAVGTGTYVIDQVNGAQISPTITRQVNCTFKGPAPVAWTPKAYPIPVINYNNSNSCASTSICCITSQ